MPLLNRERIQKFVRNDSAVGNLPRANVDRRNAQGVVEPRGADDHLNLLPGRDEAAELIRLARSGSGEAGGVGFQIFQAGAGVVNNDAVVAFEEAAAEQLFGGGDAGGAFGSDEQAFFGCELNSGVDQFGIGDGDRRATAFANRLKDQEVAQRLWNAQAAGDG